MSEATTNLVLCWHMHQPWYRESAEGDFCLPWVYLHAIKDYVDMVAHLEAHPRMRCVVNFTPVLLEQIDDYREQFSAHLSRGRRFSDPMLNLLAGVDPIPSDAEERIEIVRACRRAHAPMMIDAHPRFRDLFAMVMSLDGEHVDEGRLEYMNDRFFLDLVTWYHIAWLGYSLRQRPEIEALVQGTTPFGPSARFTLLEVMSDAFDHLLPRYRALADREQIELSMTPYGHPIVPLLIDFEAMHCALPEAPGPDSPTYPGGYERARWHMEEGMNVFEHFLGRRPTGVWLSEGGVSHESLRLLDEFDIAWTASGEGVWNNSRFLSGLEAHGDEGRRSLFGAHAVDSTKVGLFFRDDGLSDLIGFEYQQWDADDAVANFVGHVKNIGAYIGDERAKYAVSVILDGENAWEYYPDNGFHFLDALYARLEKEPEIRTMTYSEALAEGVAQPLPSLCPGSWVYGSFSTWIGETDKNRAWELLVDAKRVYDEVTSSRRFQRSRRQRIDRQLAICEGSDWFWWFGDYNPADSVSDFDRLFRQQLINLYQLLDEQPPEHLHQQISQGGGAAENSGTMRRGHG